MQLLIYVFPFLSFLAPYERNVETIYGNFTVTEPVICELLDSKAFNRLKGVNQYGIVSYIHKNKLPYSRHTHSLGVFALLRKYGASIDEQIAGLLHDVSHTVFSHVGDHLINQKKMLINQNDDAYQDEKHLWILAQTDIADILAKYDIPLERINHKCNCYHMLEKELPDICADRLEYNLYGGLAEGWLTQKDIDEILASLQYNDGCWYFDNPDAAEKIATTSIKLCRDIFASFFNTGSYDATARAMMRAVDLGVINFNDILFMQDDEMLSILMKNEDSEINKLMQIALNAKEWYVPSHESNYDLTFIAKFRGINPWIKVDDVLMRLTDVNPDFKTFYEHTKEEVCSRKYYSLVGKSSHLAV